jgi:hypothetical protein
MQWIKASQRLPEKFKPVVVRHIHNGRVRTMSNMTHCEAWNAGFDDFLYSETEWLDESQPEQAVTDEEIEEVVEPKVEMKCLHAECAQLICDCGVSDVPYIHSTPQQPILDKERDNRMRECFKRLVGLKKHKDQFGKTEYYEKHQPLVWQEAFDIIAGNGSILRDENAQSISDEEINALAEKEFKFIVDPSETPEQNKTRERILYLRKQDYIKGAKAIKEFIK